MELRQNTATTVWLGPFKSTDGVTSSTGLTVSYLIAKNNGTFVVTTGTNSESTEIVAWYKCPMTATNLNTLGNLIITAQSSSEFLDVWDNISVVTANYYDTKYGTDEFQVDVVQIVGSTSDADDISPMLAIIGKFPTSGLAGSTEINDQNNISTTDILTQGNAALVAQDLDHLVKVDKVGVDPTSGSLIDLIMNKSTDQTFSQANDSLEAIRDWGAGSTEIDDLNNVSTTDILTQSNAANLAGVNITSIITSTDAADNFLAMFDGTGYAGGAIRSQSDWVETNGDTEIDTGLTPATWTKEIYSKLINDSYKDSNEYKFYGSTGAYLFSINIATTSRTRSS